MMTSSLEDSPASGNVYNTRCPTRQVFEHVMGRWGGLILGTLRGGTYRFAGLRREIEGISEKMLAQTLRALERDGLVARRSFPVVPPRVEYSLTSAGRECADRVWDLAKWIQNHLSALVEAQTSYDGQKLGAEPGE